MGNRKGTVFVVDDDASLRSGLARLLRAAGHVVEMFDSAEAYLTARPQRQGPSCLVLDVMMPGRSGIELQAELNALCSRIPIIFVSGQGSIPVAVRALHEGAATFLEKPLDPDALLIAVDVALARHATFLERERQLAALRRRHTSLTPRERQVFTGVVAGQLNKQIAFDLGIAEKTVKAHRGRLMEKMAAGSVAELVRMAERLSREQAEDRR
jgi:FixJ family two-component response regulator